MRVSYFGQACTLIDVNGLRILTDPWLTEGAYLGTWFHTHVLADAGVTPEAFPKNIDYLFLSHEHQDHVDPVSLSHFPSDIPVFICKFPTPRFKNYLENLGLTNITELEPGEPESVGEGVSLTIFSTAEYTDDAALLVEGDGCRVFNETDCKLSYRDLERIGQRGVDLGFYMFSGANWYPMAYDYPRQTRIDLVRRRRQTLLRSLVQRVKLTKPRFAVPAAGPCTVLDPELFWLNSEDEGIFVDPELAVEALRSAAAPSTPLYMAATDVWDSRLGFENHAPGAFRVPRMEYLRETMERLAPEIRQKKEAESGAGSDLPELLVNHFNARVGAQTQTVRRRIDTKLALVVKGSNGGGWTIDFVSDGPNYVSEGIAPDWKYKIEVEDKLIYPFLSGQMPFFEDLFLSMRVRLARRPDEYNEPLYHFFYDADPERLHNWYVTH